MDLTVRNALLFQNCQVTQNFIAEKNLAHTAQP